MNFEENFKKETIFNISYTKFEQFIKFHYGIEFCFLSIEEANNDSCYDFIVKKNDIDDYELNCLNSFLKGKREKYVTHVILKDLCNKGIIPEGKYIIDVCW